MDLLIAATPHAHGARPSSRNPADLAGLHEQLAVVKVRTISPPESDLDTTHAAEGVTSGGVRLAAMSQVRRRSTRPDRLTQAPGPWARCLRRSEQRRQGFPGRYPEQASMWQQHAACRVSIVKSPIDGPCVVVVSPRASGEIWVHDE